MQFEYHTNYFPIEYLTTTKQVLFSKKELDPAYPLPESLIQNTEYLNLLKEMGNLGWELVSVQPLLRSIYRSDRLGEGAYGYGYSLTAGYYFFWKRSKSEQLER